MTTHKGGCSRTNITPPYIFNILFCFIIFIIIIYNKYYFYYKCNCCNATVVDDQYVVDSVFVDVVWDTQHLIQSIIFNIYYFMIYIIM